MRLTHRYLRGTHHDAVDEYDIQSLTDKLGQLEDIEDELGIDLITLFKALKKGFYDNKGEYHHFSNLIIDIESIYDGYTKEEFTFVDYGKTWALTKEELE